MNLRDINFSSRSVIPVELALPINRPARFREGVRPQRQAENHERDRSDTFDPTDGVASFYL